MTTPEERAAKPHEIIWAAPDHDDDGWHQSGTWNVEHSWREDDCAYIHAATAEARLAKALARVAVLEEALAFYADGEWPEDYPGGVLYDPDGGDEKTFLDYGDKARAALRGPGG